MRISFHLPGHLVQQFLAGFHVPHFRQFPVILFPGLDHCGICGVQLFPGFPQRFGQAFLRGGFLIQPQFRVRCVLFQFRPGVPHFFASGGDFLQPGFHGSQHGLQACLVVQCGRAAVHHVDDRGLLLFQHAVLFRLFRAGFLFRLPGLFQQCFLLCQGFGPFPAAVAGFCGQPFHFFHPLLCGADFLRDPFAVLCTRTPAFLHGTHGILGLMDGFHAGHQRGMRPGNLFIQLGNLVLPSVAFFTFFMKGNFGLVQHRPDSLQVPVRFLQPGFHPVAPDQEQVQVQHFQLGRLIQVNAGVLRLLLQRGKLPFQLVQDVIHPVHVFQRMGQFLVRFFLARLEFDDTRRLFEHQAPVLPFPGKDFVNPSLADDGISFLADSGIPEKIHHVLQPAGCAVQVILTVAVAVNAARNHNLRVI